MAKDVSNLSFSLQYYGKENQAIQHNDIDKWHFPINSVTTKLNILERICAIYSQTTRYSNIP